MKYEVEIPEKPILPDNSVLAEGDYETKEFATLGAAISYMKHCIIDGNVEHATLYAYPEDDGGYDIIPVARHNRNTESTLVYLEESTNKAASIVYDGLVGVNGLRYFDTRVRITSVVTPSIEYITRSNSRMIDIRVDDFHVVADGDVSVNDKKKLMFLIDCKSIDVTGDHESDISCAVDTIEGIVSEYYHALDVKVSVMTQKKFAEKFLNN